MMRKTSLGAFLALSLSLASCHRNSTESIAFLDSLYVDTVATVDKETDALTLLEELVDTDRVLRLIGLAKGELEALEERGDSIETQAYAARLQRWLDAYGQQEARTATSSNE